MLISTFRLFGKPLPEEQVNVYSGNGLPELLVPEWQSCTL